ISVAAGVDAVFSLLPLAPWAMRAAVGALAIGLLVWLNLRGVRESVLLLMPIFLGFLVTHGALVVIGIAAHETALSAQVATSAAALTDFAGHSGWLVALAFLLRAYSLGAGTYTGIEAVSNNVHTLAEPRVRTGKLAMLYMALSLGGLSGGLMVLYLLWDVAPVAGETLNATVFRMVLQSPSVHGGGLAGPLLAATLACAAALLFIAANTGFLGGPAVLANMARDRWVPHQMSLLSTRLVTHNGILAIGATSLLVLAITEADVGLLVVLYSINVFITFFLSLLGLSVFWWQYRGETDGWRSRLVLSAFGCAFTGAILVILVVEKFTAGGWVTLLVTCALAGACLAIRRHYDAVGRQLEEIEGQLRQARPEAGPGPKIDPAAPTAVFLVGSSLATGMHTMLWTERLFPKHFCNFVFVTVGEVDASSYGGEEELRRMQREVDERLAYCVAFCRSAGIASIAYKGFGADVVAELTRLCEKVNEDFPRAVFFAGQLFFEHDNWLLRMLHDKTALAMQRRLHWRGLQMMILPMKVHA
ncbi:MAG: APC family permease, partial [Geminicoccaceae bacterium]